MVGSSCVGRAMEQVCAEAQRLAAPAQVRVAPATNALEHRRNVGVCRLLERIALDRAAVFPFVFVPFVRGRDNRMQGDQSDIDTRLDIAAMVTKLVRGGLQMCQILRRRWLGPEPIADKNVAARSGPRREPDADPGKAPGDAPATE